MLTYLGSLRLALCYYFFSGGGPGSFLLVALRGPKLDVKRLRIKDLITKLGIYVFFFSPCERDYPTLADTIIAGRSTLSLPPSPAAATSQKREKGGRK